MAVRAPFGPGEDIARPDLGFTVTTMPMNKGTPFANILLIAKLDEPETMCAK